MLRMLTFAMLAATVPTVAFAHVGIGNASGFQHGITHPLGGIDHILSMIAVGVLAGQLGGRALWLVPLSFIGMMMLGGALGVAGIDLPFVEVGIGLSVVVFGLVVAFGPKLTIVAAMALVGFFAMFHGHAHGAEMPDTVSGLAYGAGFVAATAALHALGVGFRLTTLRVDADYGRRLTQVAGSAVAIAGAAILGGIF